LAASIAVRVSTLRDVKQWKLVVAMAVVVVAIWLGGAAVTKYSLEQMAFVTPIAVVVVGATVGIVLLWVKVVADSIRRRSGPS
jgi:predicted small integral membrane protein